MFWDIGVLEAFYTIIQQPQSRERLANGSYILEKNIEDLNNILLTPAKNQQSRSKLEAGKITVHGIEYDVLPEFVFAVIQLSDELNVDELVVGEFLLNISERKSMINESLITQESLVKEGRLTFFLRRQYILQILNYLFNHSESSDRLISVCMEKLNADDIGNNLISSFENVHANLNMIQESISRDTMVNQYDSSKKEIVKLKRDFLTREYDLLGQLLTGFLINSKNLYFYQHKTFTKFFALLDFIETNLVNNDSFLLYYLPAALQFGNFITQKISTNKQDYIWFLLDKIGDEVMHNEKLFMSPFRVLVYFNILVNITEWFKEDSSRTTFNNQTLNFEEKIKTPLYTLVLLGAIEELMIFASETSVYNNSVLFDDVASLRIILERHLPKLLPFLLQDVKMPVIELTGHILESAESVKSLTISTELRDYFIVNSLNAMVVKFIEHCPFILTQLKEEEEDAFINGGEIDRNNLSNGSLSKYANHRSNNNNDTAYRKADVERFFVSCFYIYNGREDLGLLFWEDKDSALNGFIKWGSNCKDSLMTSCYYVMLSAFANNKELSKLIFNFVLNNQDIGNVTNKVANYSSKISGSKNADTNYFDILASILDDFSQAIQEWESGKKDATFNAVSNLTTEIFNRHSNLGRHQFSNVSQHLKNLNDQPGNNFSAGRNSKLLTFDDLHQETVLLLTSLISFLGKLALNLDTGDTEFIANIFTNILFQLLTLNTPLVGVILKNVSYFITENNKNEIWDKLDAFVFNTSAATNKMYNNYYVQRDENKFIINPQSLSYLHYFKSRFKDIKEIFGFLTMLKKLTFVPPEISTLPLGDLLLPINFGLGNRNKKGVSPYLEYLINDILINSNYLKDVSVRNIVQLDALTIINNCLKTFDCQKLIDINYSLGTNLDLLVEQNTFVKYLVESPATYSISNFLNIEENYKFLFDLIKNENQHVLLQDLDNESVEMLKLQAATDLVFKLVKVDDAFNDIILPLVKDSLKVSKDYYPDKSIFEYNSIRNFKDCIRLDRYLIINLINNLSTSAIGIRMNCINTLTAVYESNDERQLKQLLDTIQNTEYSITLKQNLMYALDMPVDTNEDFEYKLNLLQFLSQRCESKTKVIQWLAGFQLEPSINLGPSSYQTFISSNVSVFGSIIKLIMQAFTFISAESIQLIPMKLLSASFEALNRLVIADVGLLADYLKDIGFVEELIGLVTVVSQSNTIWDNHCTFDKLESSNNSSFVTVLNFFKFRADLLEFLSVIIHHFNNNALATDIVAQLVCNDEKIFQFLDILKDGFLLPSFQQQASYEYFSQFYLSQLELYKSGVNFEPVLKNLRVLDSDIKDSIFDFKALDSLLDLRYQWLLKTSNSLNAKIPLSKINKDQDQIERLILKNNIVELHGKCLFNVYQNNVVRNWNLLVQLIVTDGNMSIEMKNNFILKTFQTLINEVELLLDSNLKYAEEFISLIVVLYDILDSKCYNIHDNNLYKLFTTATQCITSTHTSISMRSDLYVIIDKYLSTLMDQDEEIRKSKATFSDVILKKLTHDLKMLDEKLVEIVVSDCVNIGGHGPERITSIAFLKTLVKFGNFNTENKSNFMIKSLSNTNMLSNLIRSIRNFDELLHNESVNDDCEISFTDVKYELSVFKFTMKLLDDVAATKLGAYELLQNDIMSVVNKLQFYKLDLNMGTYLEFKEFVDLNLKLKGEIRIKLENTNISDDTNSNLISVFEILTPIFKLLTTILGSLGIENKTLKINIHNFLKLYDQQIKNLLKRDSLIVENQQEQAKNSKYASDLQHLINLTIVLFNEINY